MTDTPTASASLIARIRHRLAVPSAALAFGGLALALFAVPRPVTLLPDTLPHMTDIRPEAVEAIRTIPLPTAARPDEHTLATGSIAPPVGPAPIMQITPDRKRVSGAPATPLPPRKPAAMRQVAEARPLADAKPVARDKPIARRPSAHQPATARAPAEPSTILGKTLALGSDALDLTLGGARYAKSAALRIGGAVVDLIED